MSDPSLLIADIGGSNARFALADAIDGTYHDEIEYRCADFTSAQAAMRRYLEQTGTSSPIVMCLAVAAPARGEPVQFTNSNWSIAREQLRADFGAADVRLLNDFEAIALALPALAEDERLPLGAAGRADLHPENFTVGVLGPGTGLGGAGLVRRDGCDIALATEAGHVGMTAENRVQQSIVTRLRGDHGRVSCERLLSGPGLENIYRCLNESNGAGQDAPGAERIGDMAQAGECNVAMNTFDLFFEVLGQVAGDFALAIGAFDGVFIAGGIARRHANLLQRGRFREGFENKGRYRSLLQKIPTELITHPQPGLLGAAIGARQMHQALL